MFKRMDKILSLSMFIIICFFLVSACTRPPTKLQFIASNEGEPAPNIILPDTSSPYSPKVGFTDNLVTAINASIQLDIGAVDDGEWDKGITAYLIDDAAVTTLADPSSSSLSWVYLGGNPQANYNSTVSYTLSDYASGTDVYVYTWFKDAAGNVSSADTAMITVSKPDVPANLMVLPDAQGIEVSWDEVSEVGNYTLYWDTTWDTTWDTSWETSYPTALAGLNAVTADRVVSGGRAYHNHTSVSAGTPYYYVLVAEGSYGNSVPTVKKSVTPGSDTVGPLLVNQNPASADGGVVLNSNIYFEVSDAGWGVDVNTLKVDVDVAGVSRTAILAGQFQTFFSGTIVPDYDGGYQVTINPDNNFFYNEAITITVAVKDLAGNPISSVDNYTFTSVYDNNKPVILSASPYAGAMYVAPETELVIFIEDSQAGLNLDTLQVNLTIDAVTVDVIKDGVGQSGYQTLISPSGSNNNNLFLRITPDNPFPSVAEVEVDIFVHDNTVDTSLPDPDPDESNTLATKYAFYTYGGWTMLDSTTGNDSGDLVGRSYHTATLLDDGRLFIAGGGNGGSVFKAYNFGEIYDSTADQWTRTSNSFYRRVKHAMVKLTSGQVLLIGGGVDGGDNNSCELYDPATDTWTVSAPMNEARVYLTATLLDNGQVLAVGGSSEEKTSLKETATATCELYDPLTDTWTYTGSLSILRRLHTAVKLNDGRVLIIGGETTNIALQKNNLKIASCELYDPATYKWTDASSLAIARSSLPVVKLRDGNIFRATGAEDEENVAGSWSWGIYDDGVGSWNASGLLEQYGKKLDLELNLDGWVMVPGGVLNSGEVRVFNPETETLIQLPSLNVARESFTTTRFPNGDIMVTGGENNGTTNTCELFTYYKRPDILPPVIDSLSPSAGASSVAVNAHISFRIKDQFNLDENDNISTDIASYGVDRSSINVSVNSPAANAIANGVFQTGYSGTIVSDEVGGFMVRIIPDDLFDSYTSVTVSAQDLAPTPNTVSLPPWEFTPVAVETTPPAIGSLEPSDGANTVSGTTNIFFNVTDVDGYGVDVKTLNVSLKGVNAIVNGVGQAGFGALINPDGTGGYIVRINPDSDYFFKSLESVTMVVVVDDWLDNRLTKTTYFNMGSFSAQNDTDPPAVVSQAPAADATDVSRDTDILFTISDTDQEAGSIIEAHGVDMSTLNVTIGGEDVIKAGVGQLGYDVRTVYGYNNIYDTTLDGDLEKTDRLTRFYQVTINPDSDYLFDPSQVVDVVINASDLNGNVMNQVSYSYTTEAYTPPGDSAPPVVASQDPAPGATGVAANTDVKFTISDAGGYGIDVSTLTISIAGVTVVYNGAIIDTVFDTRVVYNGTDGYDVTIDPDSDFTQGNQVDIEVDATDLNGNAMAHVFYYFNKP